MDILPNTVTENTINMQQTVRCRLVRELHLADAVDTVAAMLGAYSQAAADGHLVPAAVYAVVVDQVLAAKYMCCIIN